MPLRGYPEGISRTFVGSLAPGVQINLEATVDIDPFRARASPPGDKQMFHHNDESWGGVIWVVLMINLSYWLSSVLGRRIHRPVSSWTK